MSNTVRYAYDENGQYVGMVTSPDFVLPEGWYWGEAPPAPPPPDPFGVLLTPDEQAQLRVALSNELLADVLLMLMNKLLGNHDETVSLVEKVRADVGK